MAVRFDLETDAYTKTVGIPGTTYTYTFWFYIPVYRSFWSGIVDVGPVSGVWQYFGIDAYDANIIFAWSANPHINLAPSALGVWFRGAVVRNGTALTAYAGQVQNALSSNTGTINGLTPEKLSIGRAVNNNEWFNGRVAAFKLWDAAFTTPEVENELGQYQPRRTTNLLAFHPFIGTELTDYSGGGYDLTASSTSTVIEDGPPIPWRLSSPRLIIPSPLPSLTPVNPSGAFFPFFP
jgi:hypothetical protein